MVVKVHVHAKFHEAKFISYHVYREKNYDENNTVVDTSDSKK